MTDRPNKITFGESATWACAASDAIGKLEPMRDTSSKAGATNYINESYGLLQRV